MALCAYHPDRETALACTRCDRDACPDCLEHVAVGQHCVGCTQGRPVAGGRGATAFKVRAAVVGVDERARMQRPGKAFYLLAALFLGTCIVAAFVDPVADAESAPPLVRLAAVAVVLSGAVLGLVFHEWAHAAVAYRGGDRTVADKGYLTMDVRDYSSPLLSLAMPIVLLMIGGLPLPGGAVWINHGLLRSAWWRTAVSLAGPGINLVGALAIYGFVSTGILGGAYVLAASLMFLAYLQIGIALLNLLPIPGLDGYGAIEPHLPERVQGWLLPLRQLMPAILIVLVLNPGTFSFLWSAADQITWAVGVDGLTDWLISYGEYLSSPRLW